MKQNNFEPEPKFSTTFKHDAHVRFVLFCGSHSLLSTYAGVVELDILDYSQRYNLLARYIVPMTMHDGRHIIEIN